MLLLLLRRLRNGFLCKLVGSVSPLPPPPADDAAAAEDAAPSLSTNGRVICCPALARHALAAAPGAGSFTAMRPWPEKVVLMRKWT
jgi:hypothetical protein